MSEAKTPTFILGAALPTFTWTVRVPVPGNDDYSYAELPLTFQAVEQEMLDRMRGIGVGESEVQLTDAQIVRKVVVGWPALQDAEGNDVPFSPAALERLMAAPMLRQAAVATYIAAMSGMAARKNA